MMSFKYRAMRDGIGIAIDATINIEIIHKDESDNVPISILFNDNIPKTFKESIPLIESTINHYLHLFNSQIQNSILQVTFEEIETNPAHYQVESFIGLTVMLLNEYFSINIPEPIYTRNPSIGKFVFELQD
ncbi:hypothetical protein [Edaphocola flava]|uniref:hypothetical protein n=1 Tax=Edaphocola flava TaxID=2499629 RepID=UPI00100A4D5A|nr:hypothetical protein [Edaphocola flava]